MISSEANVVWDADLYSEIFTEKNLQPLSCFHIYSDFKHILRIFQYMIQWKSSHRKENYYKIKELFVNNSRGDTKDWEYLVTYGARTALDLYLQAKNYPKGSEILITAISTDGVIETVRGKNYPNRNEIKIVPVDIQWETMGPTLVNIKSLITPKTVAIVLWYPFGIIYDIEKIASFWKQKGIDVIEDATEAFSGLSTPGSSYADLTLLSFGMLRHYSSFGGAVAVVRNNKEIF